MRLLTFNLLNKSFYLWFPGDGGFKGFLFAIIHDFC